jgi:site-specific DNA recombinase
MLHTYTVRNSRRYRYYVCLTAQQRGWDACPTKSIAAQEIEDAIVSRIRLLGSDPRIAAETARQAREQGRARTEAVEADLKVANKELGRLQRELAKVLATPGGNGMRTDRLADVQEQVRVAESRASELQAELADLAAKAIDEKDLKKALKAFDPVWNALNTGEQARLIRAVIDRVGYDGRTGKIAVTFRSGGFKAICALSEEVVS